LGLLTGFHPIVQVTSGSDLLVAPNNRVLRHLVRRNLSRADLVTAWASHMAEVALENGAVPEKLMVLPRGIPFDRLTRERCRRPTNNRVVRIISTRSLRSVYNLDLLLKAADLLRKDGIKFTVTIAGDGPQDAELRNLTEQLSLNDCLSFAGFVPND